MRRTLAAAATVLVAVICALLAASAAQAATTVRAGWRIDWPAPRTATADAGATLSVTVRPVARHPLSRRGRVEVRLTRLAGAGARRAAIAVRTARRGTVRVTLPRRGGVRYELVARARGRVLARSTVTVARPETAPGKPAPAPGPAPSEPVPPPWGPACDAAHQPAATLELDRARGRAGDLLTATIVNGGACLLVAGYPYGFERLVDGVWTAVPLDLAFIMPAIMLRPGERWSSPVRIEDATQMPPGRYRVVKWVDPLRVAAELDVEG